MTTATREDLAARMAAIAAKVKARPASATVEPSRPDHVQGGAMVECFGGPPGPSPSEGGCGHVGSMRHWERNGVLRAACQACGAEWKLAAYRGRLGMVVVRRAL